MNLNDFITALQPFLPFFLAFLGLLLAHGMVTGVLLAFFYRLTHHRTLTMWLYALLIWPGTVLHEGAHWLVARLLGVRARLPHLLPSKPDRQGRMVLGHVMVEQSDFLRRSLIGAAPFVVGSLVVAWLAHRALALPIPEIDILGVPSVTRILATLPTLLRSSESWLYLYLIFAFANGMMPSASDREAWPTLVFFLVVVGGLIFLTIGLPSPPPALLAWITRTATWLTFAFLITLLLDALLLLIVWPLERALYWLGR